MIYMHINLGQWFSSLISLKNPIENDNLPYIQNINSEHKYDTYNVKESLGFLFFFGCSFDIKLGLVSFTIRYNQICS